MGNVSSKSKKVHPVAPLPALRRGATRSKAEIHTAPLNTEESIWREQLAARPPRARRNAHHELFAPIPHAPAAPARRLSFEPSTPPNEPAGSLAKGGKVKKTGMYKLHAGELVVKKARVADVKAAVKKAKLRPLKE